MQLNGWCSSSKVLGSLGLRSRRCLPHTGKSKRPGIVKCIIPQLPVQSNLAAKGFFFMQCELSGIQAIAKMEGTAGIGAFPTSFLWLRSAKMAQNGAAEIGRCSSGQRGPAERRIGCAPAMILGHGCGMGWPCKGLAPPGRSSKRSRLRRLQQIKKRPDLENPVWALCAQRLETLRDVFRAGGGKGRLHSRRRVSRG